MKNYNFPIIIEQSKDGYFATCPQLQGCYTQGDTYEEVMNNIKEAIELHVEDILVEKEELPEVNLISLATIKIPIKNKVWVKNYHA